MPHAEGVRVDAKHDGDRLRCLSCWLNHRRIHREDDVDIHTHKFGDELRELLSAVGPSELDDNVLALGVAEVAQALA
jgi:hypothetical protein